ncbi:MAG: efflux transporter outer membrane subunit [Candidatus Omnitrophica bacterium]|nr:efflux transporter outer membrane subunit [Candidatus Omnitrophota bacterium]
MKLSELSISRPVLATMMSLGLVLFGIIGIARLPVRELPDIDPPIVNVTSVYQGASAAVIETQVTEPIEEALTSVEGIRTLTSESREQVSSITVEFDLSRPIEVAAQDVRDRVSRVRGVLPDNMEEPIVAKQDADAQPILWIALYSDRLSTLELTSLAENTFKDRLQTINGVSSVIFGGQKRFAIRLWLDSQKMAARQVTVLDVQRALTEQNVELPSGLVESWSRAMSIETRGELKTPEEYNNLVIKRDGATFIRLSDIGRAAVGVEDERSVARFNSRPAVGIGIVKQSKANTIDVAKKIKAELERIRELLPADVYTTIPYDESIFVEKSIHEVWETLGIAFLLVVLTIFIFLHDFRSTLVPSVSIPVSIIATFGLLYVMGYSINTVTMLAFVLAIGLVVDDSIIVLENIYRHVEEGMAPLDAAYKGMSEIGFAVIATTIALVAVFFPMAFQTSVTGRLFVEFAFALCFSVIISAFVALTLAPMASARFLKPVNPNEHKKLGILGFFERWLKRMTAKYERSLGWSLKHPIIVVPICAGAIALSVFFYGQLDHEFLPAEDKGRLLCIAIAPEGSTSEYTDRMVRKMESLIAATPEVEGYFSAVALSRGSPGKASQGLAFLRLKEDRKKHIRDIVGGPTGLAGQFFSQVEGAFVIPIIPQAIGRGFSQPFQLVIQGQDLDELNKYSTQLTNKLRASGVLMNVRSNFEINKPELRVHINRDRAAALGITVEDISKTLQILFGGLDLSKLNIGGKQYDVIVQLERESRLNPSDLDKLYIPNAQGKLIQLSNVVTYDTGAGPSAINHHNRYRSATIEGTPVGVPLGTVIEKVKDILREDMPEGIKYEWSGDARDLIESSTQIYFVMLLAAIVIYMVLASQFESLVHPLTIMLTLPLAAFGAFGALWVLNWADKFSVMFAMAPGDPWYAHIIPRIPSMGVNLFSQIGMILLFGLVTKNGILLVDFANQQVAKGKTPTEAMLAAGVIRLRPILMTACATIAGILPIAIGFGAGAESRRPLGVAAVGGMLTSTFLTLFVIPVVYVLFSKMQKPKNLARTVKSTAALLLVCLFLGGCKTVGPEYKRPEDPAPAQWKHPNNKSTVKVPEDAGWWTVLKDPALNDLETKALANNQNLKSAVASVDKARALARITESDLLPDVDFNPSIERSRTTRNAVSSSSGFTGRSATSTMYKIPVDLSYEVDIWGKVRRAFEAGRAEAEASEEAYKTVLLTLTADVARQYFLLRELDAEVETLKQTIDLRQKAVDVVKNRVEGGVSSELDLSRATTELAQAKADIIDVYRQRGEVENTLAVLCGSVASDFKIAAAELKVKIPEIPAGLPSELLKRRPDIAETERLMAATSAKIGVAEGDFFPSVFLTGSAGLESVELDNLLEWESRVASFGPSVNLPLFKGKRNQAKLKAARADYAMAVAKYQQQVLVAFQETEDALINVQMRREQLEAQDKLVKATSVSSKLSITRYRQGLVSFLEVVDAERSRLQAELESIRIKTQEIIATVQLIKALGGAW